MKNIIESQYYDLAEVKAFNDRIMELSQERCILTDDITMILEAFRLYEPFDNLKDFVPGSDKHQEILDKTAAWEKAVVYLKEMNHQAEVVVYEHYPKSLEITRHTYSVESFRSRYEEEDFDNPESDSYMQTFTFFTKSSHPRELITNMEDELISYVNNKHVYPKDLINEALEQIDQMKQEIIARNCADRVGVSFADFKNTFPIRRIVFMTQGFTQFIELGERKFYDRDIPGAVEKMKEAKSKRYIENDKYVEYPSYRSYLEVVEMISSGELTEVPVIADSVAQ